MLLPVLDDPSGKIRPNAGKPGKLGRSRPVQIHQFAFSERLACGPRTVPVRQCGRGIGPGAAQHHDATRRIAGVEQRAARRLPGHGQTGKQEHGSVFRGHERNVGRRAERCGTETVRE